VRTAPNRRRPAARRIGAPATTIVTKYGILPPPERLADRVQLRVAFSTDRGEVTNFVAQLEYWLDGTWQEVVRYDHDRDTPGGHDVTEEGLHRDVYRDGKKVREEQVTLSISAAEGFNYAEDDLRENAERYVRRFERWHNITGRANL